MPQHDTTTPRDLGDGLLLRWSRREDADRIAALTSEVFRDEENEPPSPMMVAYTQALMSGAHPLMTPDDFALVEDRQTNRIVACSCLLSQTWRYGPVSFPVGRPELVATLPAYRQRGLIRAIFGALHARSAARDDLAQGITGISYFYRQFGYEYALELGGGRTAYFTDIPSLPDGQQESYRLRPAEASDVPFFDATYTQARQRSLVSTTISPDDWRTKVTSDVTSDADWQVTMIADATGQNAGYVVLQPYRFNRNVVVRQIEVAPGVPMRAVVLPVLRGLRELAPTIRTVRAPEAAAGIAFALGSAHPWYAAAGEQLLPRSWPPYAWYVRVENLPRFISHVRFVLEARLAGSTMTGYSGDLRLHFYRDGLRLVFVNGKLTTAETWRLPAWGRRDYAAFPPLVFLQLLFGYRSLDDLRAIYPDVWCHEDVEPLVRALFPASHSQALPLD